MKPTPTARSHWPLVLLALSGSALLFWGCGHTREILHPQRKVSPPRVISGQIPAPRLVPVEPAPEGESEGLVPHRPIDAPTMIDVPIIDRNGR